jgi:hypothetical protein
MGTAQPRGETVSDCHVEYGADTTYGASAPCDTTPSGTDPVAVKTAVTGLSPATTYHFHVVMTTPLGTVDGGDLSFTTAAVPVDNGGGTGTGTGTGTGGNQTPDGSGTPSGPGDPSTPTTPSGPSGPSAPTGPSGPTDPNPPADTPLTSSMLTTAAKLSGTKTVAADGSVPLGTVTCPSVCGDVTITVTGPAGAARVAAAAKARKPPVYGTGKATVKQGKKVTLTFKLNAAGKKALKKNPKLKVSVTVVVKQSSGKPVTVTKALVLKPAKRKK